MSSTRKEEILSALEEHEKIRDSLKERIKKEFAGDYERLDLIQKYGDWCHAVAGLTNASKEFKMHDERDRFMDMYCEISQLLIDLQNGYSHDKK